MRLKNVCRYKVGDRVRKLPQNLVHTVLETRFSANHRRYMIRLSDDTWAWADVKYLQPANENTTEEVPVVQSEDRPTMLLGRPVIWPDDPRPVASSTSTHNSPDQGSMMIPTVHGVVQMNWVTVQHGTQPRAT